MKHKVCQHLHMWINAKRPRIDLNPPLVHLSRLIFLGKSHLILNSWVFEYLSYSFALSFYRALALAFYAKETSIISFSMTQISQTLKFLQIHDWLVIKQKNSLTTSGHIEFNTFKVCKPNYIFHLCYSFLLSNEASFVCEVRIE